ncbi:MAG TPA: hypothetical protein VNM92_14440 [Thermoanaerobaculia bacterium]|nr:hypothetical protein [Thermoanaerobaculia bacterium]
MTSTGRGQEPHEVFSVDELATALDASRSLIYLMEHLGDLTPAPVSHRHCYRLGDVRLFLESPFGRYLIERFAVRYSAIEDSTVN